VSLKAALAVWSVIADIVRETRGSVVNLRPSRIKRRAARVDKGFRVALRLILKYAFRECRVTCVRRPGRGGYKAICYVYRRDCVEEKLKALGL